MDGIRQAHQRARANARLKARARRRFGALGESLVDTHLAPVTIVQDTVPATYRIDPRSVPIEDVVKMAVDASKAAQGTSGQVVYCAASASTVLMRELLHQLRGGRHRPELRPDRGLRYRHMQRRAWQPGDLRLLRPPAGLGNSHRRV